MKIYTKTGDHGETSLFGGNRISKADPRLEAYGTVDELNCCVGLTRAFLESTFKELNNQLEDIQNQLFVVGSHLACGDKKMLDKLPILSPAAITQLEQAMDKYTAQLPELKNFILPGGGVVSAHLHYCRSVCRRAERQIVQCQTNHPVEEIFIQYINRLGDFFFVAARYACHQQGHNEILWRSR